MYIHIIIRALYKLNVQERDKQLNIYLGRNVITILSLVSLQLEL